MGKIQIDTDHARRMADDYSYVMRSFADAYAAQKKGVKIRPRLGDHMPFNYMRERQTLTFLFYPELKEAAYEISRIIGESITSDQIRGKTLPEIMESNQPIAQRDGYAFEEVVEADETHGGYGCGHVLHRPGKALPGNRDKMLCQRRSLLRIPG